MEKLKTETIDQIFAKEGFKENDDSTLKKLIYQVPLTQSSRMGELLRQLEPLDAYVDVEMNSLEDAYLEIAKHEEKQIAESTRSQSERDLLVTNHI